MDQLETIIFIFTVLVALAAVSDKIKLPFPTLLVFVGLVIGFAPFLPNVTLKPDIIFVLFLPPLLFDAAFKTSWHDFRSEIRTISTLAVSLVFVTTTLVAVAAHYLIPNFSWPLSFLLGAVISPPDAVAATSIIKGLGLNRRVVTIIEGESLVNDASALIAYRYAVAAVVSGTFVFWQAGLQFILLSAGGIVIGLGIGYLIAFAHKQIKANAIVETSLSLLTPFISYLFAELFHTSGVLAVVSTGLLISWKSREVFSVSTRIQTRAVWDTLIFLINGLVFILIGSQLPNAVKDLSMKMVITLVGYGLLISLITVVIRIVWVCTGAYHNRLFKSKKSGGITNDRIDATSWKNVLIVAWTGTRGVVSLATALAIPLEVSRGVDFPKRHSIILVTFVVILVTLVVQGSTLPLLIRLLKIKPQTGLHKKEEKDLQLTLSENILAYINNEFPIKLDEKVLTQLKKQYELAINLLSERGHNREFAEGSHQHAAFLNQMLEAQREILNYERKLLTRYHREATFNEEVIRKAEEELDIEYLRLKTIANKRRTMKDV